VILGAPLGIDMNVYNGNQQRCIMSVENRWLYCGTYLTPCCLVLLANLVLFILIIKSSLKPTYELKSSSIGQSQVRGTCIILSLLGFSWALGYLAERQEGLYFEIYIYEYAYFSTNALLGVSVCIFYCLLRREVCAAWRNACCSQPKGRRITGKTAGVEVSKPSEDADYSLISKARHRPHSGTQAGEEACEKMLEPDTSIPYRRSSGHLAAHAGHVPDYTEHQSRQRLYRAVETDSCPASPVIQHPQYRNNSHNSLPRHHYQPSRESSQSRENLQLPAHRARSVEWMTHSSRI